MYLLYVIANVYINIYAAKYKYIYIYVEVLKAAMILVFLLIDNPLKGFSL